MDPSPFWEVSSYSATEKLPSMLWNQKFHHHVHETSSSVPNLSPMNLVQTTWSYFSKIYCNIIPHLNLGFLVVSFLLAKPPKPCVHSISLPCTLYTLRITLLWLNDSNYIWKRAQVVKLRSFLQPYIIPSFFSPNILYMKKKRKHSLLFP
jgi:hypothetical protein